MAPFRLSSSPRAIASILAGIIIFLLCAHALRLFMLFALGHDQIYGLAALFDVSLERNIPTFFSVCLGLCSALLLTVIGFDARNRGNRDAIYWFVLAFGFLFIAYDEGFQVHETMGPPMRALMGGSDPAGGTHLGILFHGWVVPGVIGVSVVALFFLKFLARLPAATRNRMLCAAALFLGGCLGMEMLSGRVVEQEGYSLLYRVMQMIEEGLEMSGLAMLIYALTSHIADGCDRLEFDLHAGERTSATLPAEFGKMQVRAEMIT